MSRAKITIFWGAFGHVQKKFRWQAKPHDVLLMKRQQFYNYSYHALLIHRLHYMAFFLILAFMNRIALQENLYWKSATYNPIL